MKYKKYGSLPKFKNNDESTFQFKKKDNNTKFKRLLIVASLSVVGYLIYLSFSNNNNNTTKHFIKIS